MNADDFKNMIARAKARRDKARSDAEYEAADSFYRDAVRAFDRYQRIVVVAKNKDFPRLS